VKSGPHPRFQIFALSAAAMTLLMSLLVIALTLLVDYDDARGYVYAWVPSRRSDRFTIDFFSSVMWKLRIVAGFGLILGTATGTFNRQVASLLAMAWAELTAFLRACWVDSKAALQSESRLHTWSLAAMILIGTVLRIVYIDQPIRNDEAYTFIEYVSRPFIVVASWYNVPNNHVLHSIFARICYLLFGHHEWAIRLPAFVAGILLIPAIYIVSRLLYDSRTALLGAALTASSSILIEYSTNARGYTIIGLVFLALLAVGILALRNPGYGVWIVFAALLTAGFYTVPVMAYSAGVVVLWMLLLANTGDATIGSRKLFVRLMLACFGGMVLTVLLYAPVIAANGIGALISNRFVTPLSLGQFITGLPDSLGATWLQWTRDMPLAMTAVLVVGFTVSTLLHRKIARQSWRIVVPTVVWIGALLLFQRVVPFIRVWLFLLPIASMIAASGVVLVINKLGKMWAVGKRLDPYIYPILALTLTVFLGVRVITSGSILRSDETGTFSAAQPTAEYLASVLRSGDRVVANNPVDSPLIYTFQQMGLSADYVVYADSVLATANRVFFVTCDDQSLDYVYLAHPLARELLTQPEMVCRIGNGIVHIAYPRTD
jgi:hypothetical protein